MTPLEYAEQLRKLAANDLMAVGASVPDRTWSQLGDVILECEALVASVTTLTALELGGSPCDYGQIGVVNVAVARECANVTNDDGTTDIESMATVSVQQDRDGDALWSLGQSVEGFLAKDFGVTWTIAGNLAITTLTLTVGIT